MILILSVIKTFFFCIIFKTIAFKFLSFNTKTWPYITIISFLFFSYINFNELINYIDYLFFNSIFLTCYILFLTIVFNDSPSVFIFQNLKKKNLKEIFKKKSFVKNRLNLLKSKKLITNKNKLTTKGSFFYSAIIFLSNLLLNETN